MKLTTSGIGIKSLSVNKSGLGLYGNRAFAAWAKDGVRLYKMTQAGPNPVFTFHLKEGPAPAPYNNNPDLLCWMRSWSRHQKRGTLQNFGATEPISVALDPDGKRLHITMPPLDKCAKVLRPKGQWKAKAKLEELDRQGEMALETIARREAAEEPAAEPVPTIPSPERPKTSEMCDREYDPRPDLLEAIDLINQHKDILGKALAFSVTDAGKLRAIVEYGG
jgi:hypothetical protein